MNIEFRQNDCESESEMEQQQEEEKGTERMRYKSMRNGKAVLRHGKFYWEKMGEKIKHQRKQQKYSPKDTNGCT